MEKSCTDFLKSCIDDDSCLMILQKPDTFALEHLREVAKRHALRNFTNASKSNGFLTLPCQLLKELLGSEDICVVAEDLTPCEDEREKILLQAALKFVKHHRAGRVQCLTELACYQTWNNNAPFIWNPRLPPFGLERGIHFLSKWKWVKSPVPGDNSQRCFPPPLLFHTHMVHRL